jgi:hypothetical protein
MALITGKLQERLRSLLREEDLHRRPQRGRGGVPDPRARIDGLPGRRRVQIFSRQEGNILVGASREVQVLH